MKKAYSLFHINTSFSSIERKNLKEVIYKCYWPLLKLVEKNDFKISIEATGKSLMDINSLEPLWILKLKELIFLEKCEFIGSGYSQIIAPSVPFELNIKNIIYGNEIYKKLLNFKPQIALINEQAFSNSLIQIYKKFFKAIVIDHLNHPKCESDNQEPQILIDNFGNKIPVIWSNSISFQRFQRYIFGDINQDDYATYLKNYNKKFFCLYSSDAEIFNYRPRGSKSERPLYSGEWIKIDSIYKFFQKSSNFKLISFKDLLNEINKKKKINMTSIVNPTIVKKQKKYNINRWLLAGRNNIRLNTLCMNAYNSIKQKKNSKKDFMKLCELWGSDFRTFATDNKIRYFYRNVKKLINNKKIKKNKFFFNSKNKLVNKSQKISEDKNYIYHSNSKYSIILNKKKGLTIDGFYNYPNGSKKLFGTIKQGIINSSLFESDFFSTHFTILNKSSLKRYSGLSENKIRLFSQKNCLIFRTIEKVGKNCICKKEIVLNNKKPEIIINYKFKDLISSYTRLNFITFDPINFYRKKIFVRSHLGGKISEKFELADKSFNHGSFVENVGSLVTTNNSIPASDGIIIIGDDKKEIKFEVDQNLSCLVPFIEYEKKKGSFLLRLYFSAKESDETNSEIFMKNLSASIKINIQNK